MGKKKFKDIKEPGARLQNQLKFETGKTYHIKIAKDDTFEWDEMWPWFPTGDGRVTKRIVSDPDDKKNSSLVPVFKFKKEVGLPAGVPEKDSNWRPSRRYGTVVAIGTEVVKKVTPQMIKKRPALKNKKVMRMISWDTNELKIWLFGLEIMRLIDAINKDADNRDAVSEKGLDPEEVPASALFSLKVEKIQKGSQKFEVDYNVVLGKYVKPFEGDDFEESYAKVFKELEAFVQPTPIEEVEQYIAENSGGMEEADSIDEEEAPDGEDIELPDEEYEEEEEKPKKKSLKKPVSKKKKKAPEPEPEEEDDEEEEEEPEEEDDEDLDLDEEEEEEEEESPPPKSKKKKAASKKSTSKKKKKAPEPEDEEDEEEDDDDLSDLDDLDDL